MAAIVGLKTSSPITLGRTATIYIVFKITDPGKPARLVGSETASNFPRVEYQSGGTYIRAGSEGNDSGNVKNFIATDGVWYILSLVIDRHLSGGDQTVLRINGSDSGVTVESSGENTVDFDSAELESWVGYGGEPAVCIKAVACLNVAHDEEELEIWEHKLDELCETGIF